MIFNDSIEIECKVFEKEGSAWVNWPSRHDEELNQWVQQVFIRDKFKRELDDVLLKKYKVFKTEGGTDEWR